MQQRLQIMSPLKPNDLISVIMPVFNAEEFLVESIESVIAQTYSNWELIIVNDGSTDSSAEIIDTYATSDKRIRSLWQPNGKQGKARNLGIKQCSGHLLAFLDADDYWFPEFLEEQLNYLNATKSDLVFSRINREGVPDFAGHAESPVTLSGVDGLRKLLKANIICIHTVLVKKECVKHAGLFSASDELQYGEDFELWLKIIGLNYTCRENPKPLAFYRSHNMQSSKNVKSKYLQIVKMISSLPHEGIQDEKSRVLYVWFRRALRYPVVDNDKVIHSMIDYMPSAFARMLMKTVYRLFPFKVGKRLLTLITFYA